MAGEEATANGATPADRHTIGISFGNSNSSIAYTTTENKAEVIANEEGGKFLVFINAPAFWLTLTPRSSDPLCPILYRR
jgi:molecular chaperone DnaK (HSP70)